jgi:hypothetical protein
MPERTRCSWPLHQVPTRPNCSPYFLNTESSPIQVHCQRLRVGHVRPLRITVGVLAHPLPPILRGLRLVQRPLLELRSSLSWLFVTTPCCKFSARPQSKGAFCNMVFHCKRLQ